MTAASVTTTPGQLIEVTLPPFAAVKLVNVTGAAPVYFTIDDTVPTVGGPAALTLPGVPGGAVSARTALHRRGRLVRLVSPGATTITLQVATKRTLTVIGGGAPAGPPVLDLDANVAALVAEAGGLTLAALRAAFAPLVDGKVPLEYLPDGFGITPPSGSGTYPAVYPATY